VTRHTHLLALLHLNNETGVVQDLSQARSVRYQTPQLRRLVDWVQSQGKWPLDLKLEATDLLSCSAHKVHGVRGAALLFVRSGVDLEPVIVGGAQEKFRRAGTVDVAAVAAYARAIQLAPPPEQLWPHLQQLERELLQTLTRNGTEFILHGPPSKDDPSDPPTRLPGFLNLAFPAMTNKEDLLIALDLEGVHASATSACHSGVLSDSHVLAAMEIPAAERACSIRIAFSAHQTREHARRAAETLGAIVARARAHSAGQVPAITR
jgi:cysteine desulfurase